MSAPWTQQSPPGPGVGDPIQGLLLDEWVAADHTLLAADLDERWTFGCRKYGNDGLRAHDGRDTIADAYEEALDLAVYLRKADAEGVAVDELLIDVVRVARDLRGRLNRPEATP